MLSLFKGPKSKKGKNVGQAILALGQFLSRAKTWADQVKICKDHGLDVFRLRAAEANMHGTEVGLCSIGR